MAGDIAELGIVVDSSGVEKAKVSLDELAQSGERAEQSAQGVGEAWSSVGQKAGSAAGNVGGASTAFKAGNEAIRQQQQELGKLLGQIDPVVAALDRLDQQEQKLRGFRATGALDAETFERFNAQIQQNRAALSGFDESLNRTGVTAGQTRQALRQLPAQFTDIFVSLQAGQSPLTVFLQQGAQIKDSFGGVGAALRETGKFALGLVNPFTLAAGAVLALGAAYQQGSEEAVAFNKALILTGNAAGTTAESLADTARAIDGVIGTQAKASEVLAQLAATGKIGAEQFELLATAAISFEDATGQAIEKSIDAYVKLGEAPVDALLKLNEGTNFLTESVLEQVIALQRNGEQAEAARVAQEAYAKSQLERSEQVRQELGYLETAWNAVTNAAKETWDAMLDAGRQETPEQEIQRLEEQLTRIAELGERRGRAQFGIGADQGNADAIRARIDALKAEGKVKEDNAATEGKGTSERNKRLKEIADREKERKDAQEEFDRIRLSNLTKEQRLEQEIANIRKTGQQAGISDSEIEAQVEAARQQAESRVATRRTRTAATPAVRDDAATRLLLNLREQQSALELQLSTEEKLTRAETERAKFLQQISDLQGKDILTAEQKSLLAAQDSIKAQLDKNVAIEREIALRDEALKFQDRVRSVEEAINAGNQARRDQQIDLLGTSGLGRREREIKESFDEIRKEYARYKADLAEDQPADVLNSQAYRDAVAEIDASLAESLENQRKYYEKEAELRGNAKAGFQESVADYISDAEDLNSQVNDLTSSALGGLEDAFVDLATTGKANFKDLADSIIADIVRIGTRLLIAEALQGFGSGTTGGNGGGNNSTSQITGLIGAIGSLFNYEGGGWTGSGERAGGMDGRGGFLAMLHPNETVIDHTRSMVMPSMGGGRSVSIGSIVLPGVTNQREAKAAAATVGREINRAVSGSSRYA